LIVRERKLIVDRTSGFVFGVDSIEVEYLVSDEKLMADVIISEWVCEVKYTTEESVISEKFLV
jgi:hypothetical protein